MSKYNRLEEYLNKSQKQIETLNYEELERIFGFSLPKSAYIHRAWWSNGGHSHANAWNNPGWKVTKVELGQFITFTKIKIADYQEIKPTKRSNKIVVLDGSNIAYGSSDKAFAQNIKFMIDALKKKGFIKFIVIVDASLRHKIEDKRIYNELMKDGLIKQSPARTSADKFIIEYAKEKNAIIISNDTFSDWKMEDAWVKLNIDKYRTPFMIIDGIVKFDNL